MFKKFKQENVVLSDIIDFMERPGHSELLSEVDTVLIHLVGYRRRRSVVKASEKFDNYL
jgi:hypothetical protein